jgi:predicted permease
MNASIFKKGTQTLYPTLIAVAVVLLSAPSAFSAAIINDRFNYADDASLTAVWS